MKTPKGLVFTKKKAGGSPWTAGHAGRSGWTTLHNPQWHRHTVSERLMGRRASVVCMEERSKVLLAPFPYPRGKQREPGYALK